MSNNSQNALTGFQMYPNETLKAAIQIIRDFRRSSPEIEAHADAILSFLEKTIDIYNGIMTVKVGSSMWSKIEEARLFAISAATNDESYNEFPLTILDTLPEFYDHEPELDANEVAAPGAEAMNLMMPNPELFFHYHWSDPVVINSFEKLIRVANMKSKLFPPQHMRVGNWFEHQKAVLSVMAMIFDRNNALMRIDINCLKPDPEIGAIFGE
jgi:hypothetical protein